MPTKLKANDIIDNLKLLSDWLRVKHPTERLELVVVGGAAMALSGIKGQTRDMDLLHPGTVSPAIKEGIAHISRVKRLGPEWMNTNVANILGTLAGGRKLPDYFSETSKSFDVADNLKVSVIGRQALISLKMLAATPSYGKHTDDIKSLQPNVWEVTEAVRFVLDMDDNEMRREDLEVVLREVGFEFNEIVGRL